MKLTNEQFLQRVKTIYQDRKYSYTKTHYNGSHNKVVITCSIHGDFEIEPRMIYKGKGCPYCENRRIVKNESRNKTTEQFIKDAKKVHGDKYDYSKTVYKRAHDNVTIICPIHGEFQQTPTIHLRGGGCQKCGREKANKAESSTTEEFIKKATKIHNGRYDYSKVHYINNSTKVCIICKEHGEFWQRPNDHLSGKGCCYCNKSKGEICIENYLKSHNIEYYSEYEISVPNTIRKSGKIRVDFYLPSHNLFIEYNGQQHYVLKEHFGGKAGFIQQQNRDLYLREYSKNNNINLLEISYKDNIEKCLEEYLQF